MKIWGLLLAAFVLLVIPAWGQNSEELKADWHQACKLVREAHPAMGLFITKQEVDSLEQLIPETYPEMDKVQLLKSLQELFFKLGCVHSAVIPTDDLYPKQLYPDSGALILQSGELYHFKPTMKLKVIEVEGQAWRQVFLHLKTMYPGDGPLSTYAEGIISRNVSWSLRRWFLGKDTLNVIYENNQKGAIVFNHPPRALLGSYSPIEKRIKLFKSKEGDTAFLSVPSFGSQVTKRQIRGCLKALIKKPSKVVFIDLRDNTGGGFPKVLELVKHFSDSTITLKALHPKGLKLRGNISVWHRFMAQYTVFWSIVTQGGVPHFDSKSFYYELRKKPTASEKVPFEKLMVLTNELTLSSGSMAASYLKHYGKAKIWGKEGGGTACGSQGTHIFEVRLKHSKIKIQLPLSRLEHGIQGLKNSDLVWVDSSAQEPSLQKVKNSYLPVWP